MSPDEPPTKRRSTATRTTAEESKHTADDVIETIIRGVGLVTVDITDYQCSQTDLRSISTRTQPSPSYRDSPRRCAHRGRDEQGPKRMMRCAQPVSRSRWKRGPTEAKMEAGTDRSKCLFGAALNRHWGRDGSGTAQPASRSRWTDRIECLFGAALNRHRGCDGSGDRSEWCVAMMGDEAFSDAANLNVSQISTCLLFILFHIFTCSFVQNNLRIRKQKQRILRWWPRQRKGTGKIVAPNGSIISIMIHGLRYWVGRSHAKRTKIIRDKLRGILVLNILLLHRWLS